MYIKILPVFDNNIKWWRQSLLTRTLLNEIYKLIFIVQKFYKTFSYVYLMIDKLSCNNRKDVKVRGTGILLEEFYVGWKTVVATGKFI